MSVYHSGTTLTYTYIHAHLVLVRDVQHEQREVQRPAVDETPLERARSVNTTRRAFPVRPRGGSRVRGECELLERRCALLLHHCERPLLHEANAFGDLNRKKDKLTKQMHRTFIAIQKSTSEPSSR